MKRFLSFCLLLFPSFLVAQDFVSGAEAAGRAGTGVSSPDGDSALFVNPAGISLTPNLVTGLLYQITPRNGQFISLIAVDGTAPYVDGGLSSTTFFSEELKMTAERSAASFPLGKRSALGVTQTMLFRDDLPKGDRLFFSADAGLLIGLGSRFSFGLAMTNFANARPVDRERILSAGSSLIVKNFRFSVDGGLDLTPTSEVMPIAKASAEWLVKGKMVFRGGYSFDATGTTDAADARHAAALGFSFRDERSTLDFAYEQRLAGSGFSRVTIGVRFFLQGMNGPTQPNPQNRPATPGPTQFGGAKGS